MSGFTFILAVCNICAILAIENLKSNESNIEMIVNVPTDVSNRRVEKFEFENHISRGKTIRELTVNINTALSGRSSNYSQQRVKCDDLNLRNPNPITKTLVRSIDVIFSFFELDDSIKCTVDFDISKPKGNQSNEDFILRTTLYISGDKINSNVTYSKSDTVLSISYTGSKCDFDTNCFLQYNTNVKVVQIGDTNSHLCEELHEKWNNLIGYFGYLTGDNKRRLYSNVITGSTFGSFLEVSIWQSIPDYQMLVVVVLEDRSRIIADRREYAYDYESQQEWRIETIQIDKIDEAFYILLEFDSWCPVIVDNITLHIIDQEDSFKAVCGKSEFSCTSGQCIGQNKTCDMIQDCFNGDDESKENGCRENNNITSCDFETSLCGWIIDETTSDCTWKIKDSNQIRLEQNLFDLQQRGNILYLNGSDCVESTVTLTSPKFKQHAPIQNNKCRIQFSYILYNTFLDVFVCTDDVCTKGQTYGGEYTWITEIFMIPFVTERMQIQFGGRIYNKLQHKFIGLDAVSIDSSCFSHNVPPEDTKTTVKTDSMKHSHYSIMSITIVSVTFVCTITTGVIILVFQGRKSRIKAKFSVHKMSADHILYCEHSTYSPLYSPIEDVSIDEFINSIPRQRITIQRLIAKGNFGEVYHGLLSDIDYQKKNIPVAVKTLPRLCSEQTKSDFFVEGITLSKLKHSNIVRLLGISLEGSSMYLVCELMNGGDLRTHVRLLRGEIDDTTTKILVNYVIDVASGCQYLEENGCIHRDLAARNCLLNVESGHMVVKVGDFGMSRFIGRTNYYRKTGAAPLPVKWMSPEAFLEGMFTSKTDVWSFGILLWEVYTLGLVPYPGKSHEEVMEFVKNGGTPCKPDLCTDDIYELMLGCWNLSPEDRPNFISLKTRLLSIKERGRHTNFIQNYYSDCP